MKRKSKDTNDLFEKLRKLDEESEKKEQEREEKRLQRQIKMEEEYLRRERREEREDRMLSLFTNFMGQMTNTFKHYTLPPSPYPHHSSFPPQPPYPTSSCATPFHLQSQLSPSIPQSLFPRTPKSFRPTEYRGAPSPDTDKN